MDIQEPDFDEYYESQIDYKICNRCGEEGLHWEDIDGENGEWTGKPKWRLHNRNGELHTCTPKPEDYELEDYE